MKKFLVIFSVVAIIAAIYALQSCSRELISSQPTVEFLLEDQDFKKFAETHWEFTSQFKFFRADISDGARGEFLKRTQELGKKNASSFSAEDSKEVTSLLGFENEVQMREFLVRYNTQYQAVKSKFTGGNDLSDQDMQAVIFEAYSEHARGEGWEFKKNRKGGFLYSSRLVNIKDLTTVQLRSCTPAGCANAYDGAINQAKINMNNSITNGLLAVFGISVLGGPGSGVLVGAGAVLVLGNAAANFAIEMNTADHAYDSCMGHIVSRNLILTKN